jgi:hypothetical protein
MSQKLVSDNILCTRLTADFAECDDKSHASILDEQHLCARIDGRRRQNCHVKFVSGLLVEMHAAAVLPSVHVARMHRDKTWHLVDVGQFCRSTRRFVGSRALFVATPYGCTGVGASEQFAKPVAEAAGNVLASGEELDRNNTYGRLRAGIACALKNNLIVRQWLVRSIQLNATRRESAPPTGQPKT